MAPKQKTTIKSISTAELHKELERRKKSASKLHARRAKLLEEIEVIDKELATFARVAGVRSKGNAGSVPGRPRRRARNEISLPDAIVGAMEVRAVVSPAEAAELVKSNGYKTTSKNFNMMVSNALAKDKRFKRIDRGQYERIA